MEMFWVTRADLIENLGETTSLPSDSRPRIPETTVIEDDGREESLRVTPEGQEFITADGKLQIILIWTFCNGTERGS